MTTPATDATHTGHATRADLTFRRPAEADHARVLAVLDSWWGGFKGAEGARERALLLPRLYFQHFTSTSTLAEYGDGRLAAFLIGFVSQTDPRTAYVHFVGVDPALQGQGVGRLLYQGFFSHVRTLGVRRAGCITSPGNAGSRAFHTRLGFTASEPLPDYDGPGLDRVAFHIDLAAETTGAGRTAEAAETGEAAGAAG
ncbi:GNAT family N-acetyltransferase [Streptomyces sp. NPDC048603]|uniref:GNAT family N-acetyltransferase n=1 Tax=Streptomyces sp. NPDC048603 TaxID=3365577 RepID=UPI003720031D